jgi:hypothetical protein
LSHKHEIRKTHVSFIEFDDLVFSKLADIKYFGEGNSKGRVLEFDFEYCLVCDFRLLDGKPIMTRDILEEAVETIIQHTDFEIFERLLKHALEFGKLREDKT